MNISGTGLVSNTIGVLGFQDTATGTANISGGSWVNSIGLMLGDEGAGTVNLTGGTITAPNVSLAEETGSTGIFNVGIGTTAGILNAAVIDGGDGTAQLNFNHSQANYFFTDNGAASGNAIAITGRTAVRHLGAGTTILKGNNTHTGGTTINAGTLQTQAPTALGTGPVTLNNGTLAPVGQLDITSMDWKGGTVASVLGTTTSLLNIAGELTLDGGGQFQFIADGGFAANTNYNILNAANLAGFTIASFMGNALMGLKPVFTIIGNQLFVNFVGPSTGRILQNSGPVFTPLDADFLVNGEVTTGALNEDNRVNSLTFNPDSSLRIFNTLTVTNGNFTVPTGSALMTGGTVIVPGDFSKLGDGLLDIFSDVFVGGAANVIRGSLLVNGSFTTIGGLTVFPNALLGGEGVINGDVFNNGIVAPGNSPGTLTINGNFTQSGSGTLEIKTGDLLRVSGLASLAGTLRLIARGKLSYGQQIRFLQAGSITGDFDEILMPDPGRFRGRLLAEDGTGTLLVAPSSYTLVAETTNQKNAARALDGFIPARGDDREVVSTALDLQSEDQYPAAFDQISPAYYESLGNIVIQQAFAQTQQMNQRMSAVRLGVRGFHAIGLDPEPLVYDKDGRSVMDGKNPVLRPESAERQWSLWAMGNGMFGKMTNVSQVPNYRFDSGGFLFGADHTIGSRSTAGSPQLTLGVYGGYEYTWADAESAGNTQINTALFGGYAGYSHSGFYADAIVGGGYNSYRVRRAIEFSTIDRTARSKPNGGQLNASLNLGYDWQIGSFTFGPIAGVQYSYAGIATFSETGAESLNLNVGQQNVNSLRTTLGGRVAYTWNVTESIALIPEIRMLWQHEFLNNPRNIQSALDGGSGQAFGYETSAPARDSVFAGAGVSAQFGQNWNAFVNYNIDFGRQDFLGNMISGGLGWKF